MALRTFSELKTRLFKRTGLDSDDQDHIDIVEQAINDWYEDILSRDQWMFLMREGFFSTVAPYSDGTVTVSGATVTGTGTVFTSEMEGRYIHLEQLGEESHQITSVNSTTSLTLLESASANIVSGSPFSIFQADYALADGVDEKSVKYIVDVLRSTRIFPAPLLEEETLFPNQGALSQAVPENFSFVGRSAETAVVIRLRPIPNDVRGYKYVALETITELINDEDIPNIPERFQNAIEEGARADIFTWIGKDKLADKHEGRAEKLIRRMIQWNRGMTMHAYAFKPIDIPIQDRGLRLPPNFPPFRY